MANQEQPLGMPAGSNGSRGVGPVAAGFKVDSSSLKSLITVWDQLIGRVKQFNTELGKIDSRKLAVVTGGGSFNTTRGTSGGTVRRAGGPATVNNQVPGTSAPAASAAGGAATVNNQPTGGSAAVGLYGARAANKGLLHGFAGQHPLAAGGIALGLGAAAAAGGYLNQHLSNITAADRYFQLATLSTNVPTTAGRNMSRTYLFGRDGRGGVPGFSNTQNLLGGLGYLQNTLGPGVNATAAAAGDPRSRMLLQQAGLMGQLAGNDFQAGAQGIAGLYSPQGYYALRRIGINSLQGRNQPVASTALFDQILQRSTRGGRTPSAPDIAQGLQPGQYLYQNLASLGFSPEMISSFGLYEQARARAGGKLDIGKNGEILNTARNKKAGATGSLLQAETGKTRAQSQLEQEFGEKTRGTLLFATDELRKAFEGLTKQMHGPLGSILGPLGAASGTLMGPIGSAMSLGGGLVQQILLFKFLEKMLGGGAGGVAAGAAAKAGAGTAATAGAGAARTAGGLSGLLPLIGSAGLGAFLTSQFEGSAKKHGGNFLGNAAHAASAANPLFGTIGGELTSVGKALGIGGGNPTGDMKFGPGGTGGADVWPVHGTISQMYGHNGHPGIDISAPLGTPIVAAEDGVVRAAGPASGFGNWVVIDGPGGEETVYGHMKTYFVRPGQQVKAGQQIALVGSEGKSTGPHLHFEVHEGASFPNMGHRVDPYPLLKGAKAAGTLPSNQQASQTGNKSRATAAINTSSAVLPRDESDVLMTALGRTAAWTPKSNTSMNQTANISTSSSSNVPAAPSDPGGNAALAKQLAAQMYGWTGAEYNALYNLGMGESGWRTNAKNPDSGAYGIPQSYPASKMASEGPDWMTNPATQIKWMLKYIKGTYKDPINAWNTWNRRSPHWYKQGSYDTEEGPANLHGHEMVLDELHATPFRRYVEQRRRGSVNNGAADHYASTAASGGRPSGDGGVTVNLTMPVTIKSTGSNATDARALVGHVRSLLTQDAHIAHLGSE